MEDLAALAAGIGLSLTSHQLVQFAQYEQLLLEWNQRLNLTAIREPAGIRFRHFLDSLTLVKVTGDLNGAALVDVGAGAGFPGFPLKILFPELSLTLVESTGKKARFLEQVSTKLALSGVTIIADRVETVGRQAEYREQFDWATARGVAELRVLAEYLLPLLRLDGHMIAQKGAGAAREVTAAAKALAVLGGSAPQLHPVQVPGLDQQHFLVIIRKERATPTKYPRRPGVPARRPL